MKVARIETSAETRRRLDEAASGISQLRMDHDELSAKVAGIGEPVPPGCPLPPAFPGGKSLSRTAEPLLPTAFRVTLVTPAQQGEDPYWEMCVPDMCVQVDGADATPTDGVSDGFYAIKASDATGTYRCVVTKSGGAYSSKIVHDPDGTYETPEDAVADVPLFVFQPDRSQYPDGPVRFNVQVHLGVIALTSGGAVADLSVDVTDEDVSATEEHGNGGVMVTVTPSKGVADSFTIWHGNDGKPGGDGKDAVVDVTQAADAATSVHKNGGTKVTLTPNNGGAAATFDVWNGNDGANGSDGRSLVSASAGTPTQSGDYTLTPVTFTDDKGNKVGPVSVSAKNGADAVAPTVSMQFVASGTNKLLQYRVGNGNWITLATAVPVSSVV